MSTFNADASPDPAALVEEGMRKAGLVWLRVDDRPPRAVWFLWREGAAYVLTGPGEQDVPGLAVADIADVVVPSRDTGAHLVTWRAQVAAVPPGPEWETVAPPLLAARLNVHDPPRVLARWRTETKIHRLRPVTAGPGEFRPNGVGGAGRNPV